MNNEVLNDNQEKKDAAGISIHAKRVAMAWFVIMLVVGITYIGYAVHSLYSERVSQATEWATLSEGHTEMTPDELEWSKNATKVYVGTSCEDIKNISIKDSSFRAVYLIWFRWTGNDDLDMANNFTVFNSYINKKEIMKEIHDGDMHYQLIRLDVTTSKAFHTSRFPLDSHRLRMYIEPNESIYHVVLVDDGESFIGKGATVAGYDIYGYNTALFIHRDDSLYGDPELTAADNVNKRVLTEYVTAIDINRSSFGLYFKCFIALLGTTTWIFITLFICTFHHVDPLGMIPAALFGTVSNIMVGANLLPDALDLGLLEYVNIWGIWTILMGAIIIINLNRVRNKHKDNVFAKSYGRVMIITLFILVLAGHILMPLAAYGRI